MKKSIFLFFAAILCATNAWGAKLFFDHSSVNYPADGALVAIWSWGGSSSDAWSVFKASGATNKIVADIADGRTGGKIVRFNSSVTKPDWSASQWNSTGDISFPSDKNCIKITSWDNATSGTWSKFQLESQASITPSASSVSVGEEVTFTPALTSNQEYNDVLSTTYSVGAGATITDGKFVATEAGTYTVTATVTYNAQGYTNITKTATATCSITVSAVAVPHPVTGVTVAPTSVTIKQGATTTLTATVAPSNADDPSVTWSSDNQSVATVVNGVVTAVAAGTANITVTTVDGGFTATCAVKVKPSQYTFHAINSAQWPTVAAHYWGGADGGSSWPGADMVKESETINGFDIYSITISSDFINIMFTNQLNGDDKNKKTADLTTEGNDGKYYDIKEAKWYASLNDIPTPAPVVKETVYFVNTGNWEKVYAYAWSSSDNGWPGTELTANGEKIGEFDIYPFEAEQDQWANIIFNNNSGTQTADLEWETGKYYVYRTGEWYDTPEAAEEALAGPATIVLHGNFVNPNWEDTEKLTISDDQKTATITVLIENGSYEFGVKQNGEWVANGKAFTKDNNEHEIVAGEGNLTLVADITGNYTFTWTYETNTLTITYPTEEVVIEKHYYVRGSHTNWEVDEDYELTLTDGVYKKEVTLAKDVEFKINDGDKAWWGVNNLGGKVYKELEKGSDDNIKMKEEKTFTIIFNPAENLITFEDLTPAEPAEVKYVLMGVNGDWTTGIPLTVTDNTNEYILKGQTIIKATDAIKVVTLTDGVATAWCGDVDSYSDVTYTYDDNGNISLADGIYDFYFKLSSEGNQIYIDQTGYARNVTNTYGTICLPYAAASTAGATFFEVVGQEAGKVYLASVTELEAGVPYIFEKSANQIKVVYKGDKENAPVNTGANGLIGNFTNDKVVPAGNYILYNNEFRKSDGEAKVNAYRAYLDLSAVEGGKPTHTMPGRRYIGMSVQGENETTGVEDIFTTDAPVKVIENGQLIIIRDGVKYNVQGQKL